MAAVLSLLWWRTDALRCACEFCPDGHCLYAEHVRDALLDRDAGAWRALADFAHGFLHAQIPLSALLAGVTATVLASAAASFMLVSALATLVAWIAVRRSVVAAWRVDGSTLALLAVVFFTNFVVVRGFVRPVSDAVGMACCVLALRALVTHLEDGSARSARWLIALQVAGAFSRSSYLPMLGMPALAELLRGRPLAAALPRAIRAGVLFGLVPAVIYGAIVWGLGIEHTLEMWRSAHQPQYVSQDRVRELLQSLWLAGGGSLALGVLAFVARAGEGRARTARIHIAWIALYVAFLFLGGGALWPRYCAPIVPSVVILLAPALDAVVAYRRGFAVALVAGVALWSLGRIDAKVGDLRGTLRVVAADVASGRFATDPDFGLRRIAPVQQRYVASENSGSAAADGDPATAWRTAGAQAAGTTLQVDLGSPHDVRLLRLRGSYGEQPRALLVEGSPDGRTWRSLGAARVGERTPDYETLLVHLPGDSVRHLRLRLTESAGSPWSVRELDLFE